VERNRQGDDVAPGEEVTILEVDHLQLRVKKYGRQSQ
jgi:hypothetical protein